MEMFVRQLGDLSTVESKEQHICWKFKQRISIDHGLLFTGLFTMHIIQFGIEYYRINFWGLLHDLIWD